MVPVAGSVPELSGLGLLTWVYPPDLVDRVVAACGRAEQRRRLLPARLVVYFVLGMALFSPAPYLEVLRHLTEGLRGAGLWGGWRIPAKSSLFRARERLGPEPLRVLFAAAAGPLADERTPGAFWRGLRLVAVDGTCWDAADSPANDKEFGRPGSSRGPDKAAFVQVRMAALVECGTHAVLDAELEGCRVGELTLSARLVRSAGPGMLVLADREFLGVRLWRAFAATGAHLLWRVPANRVLPVQERLPDGSWLSRIHAGTDAKKRDPVRVRVIAYGLEGIPRAEESGYRLVTDLLDPMAYPAAELAALYHRRWEIESVLGEIKTHQRGAKVVLSSKTPDGVRQQIWAHLLVHHALRVLMWRTAAAHQTAPDRLSFTDTLRAARRSVTASPGIFSP
ncbi:IS4 family transposase [Streptomyces sp. RPA4-5]|uniref:IS4 family transposase n=1 Tax=Streptomyces sp. RPA4-5 TaxID=2721245 RepID=UPI00143E95A5|nr:IS4 family transposase [Streptomyces sp. RPA4-5]QIY60105.1 IS4 family transposase [Streptomyces sp. RPA4-5]QIY60300.1 IS4 family transposase [Streptomyces sp. RPA4-5]